MKNKPKVLSFFSGAMGLDLGIEQAGFEIKVCLELDKKACQTIRLNKPDVVLLEKDICLITSEEILKAGKLKKDDVDLIIGGPPCQSFSTAGKRQAFNDLRGNALLHYIRIIEEIKPKYFVLENVKGILSAALKHRPLNQRGKDFPELTEEEKPGSILKYILNKFKEIGYEVDFNLLNSADYGIPQKRERVIFIGSRDGYKIEIPKPTHTNKNIDGLLPWVTIENIIKELENIEHTYVKYNEEKLSYMKLIPKGGGYWKDLPLELQKKALGGAFNSTGGRVGFFRRVYIDRPSPTLLTSPNQKSTNLGHPYEDRPLSIQEYQKIQQFPEGWKFSGSIMDIYKQIGNAVPVGLSYIIGTAIMEHIKELKKLGGLNE